jgi:hypothetical protein
MHNSMLEATLKCFNRLAALYQIEASVVQDTPMEVGLVVSDPHTPPGNTGKLIFRHGFHIDEMGSRFHRARWSLSFERETPFPLGYYLQTIAEKACVSGMVAEEIAEAP